MLHHSCCEAAAPVFRHDRVIWLRRRSCAPSLYGNPPAANSPTRPRIFSSKHCHLSTSESTRAALFHTCSRWASRIYSRFDSVSPKYFLIWPLLSPLFALLLLFALAASLLFSSVFPPLVLPSDSLFFLIFISMSLFHSLLFAHAVVWSQTHTPRLSTLFYSPSCLSFCFLFFFFSSWNSQQCSFHFCSLKWCHKVVGRKDGMGGMI